MEVEPDFSDSLQQTQSSGICHRLYEQARVLEAKKRVLSTLISSECTFHPNVNRPKSSRPRSSLSQRGQEEDVAERLYKHAEAKRVRDEQRPPEFSFAPSINATSRRIASKSRDSNAPAHEILYKKAIELNNEKVALSSSLPEECTFVPAITKKAASLKRGSLSRLYQPNWQGNRLKPEFNDGEENSIQLCTFTPKLVSKSPQKLITDGPRISKHEQLYQMASKKASERDKKREEYLSHELTECTFRPKLFREKPVSSASSSSKSSVHNRLFSQASEREDRRQRLYMEKKTQEDEVGEECTFEPVISKKSLQIIEQIRGDSIPRHLSLYETGVNRMNQKRNDSTPLSDPNCTFKPNISTSDGSAAINSATPHAALKRKEQRRRREDLVNSVNTSINASMSNISSVTMAGSTSPFHDRPHVDSPVSVKVLANDKSKHAVGSYNIHVLSPNSHPSLPLIPGTEQRILESQIDKDGHLNIPAPPSPAPKSEGFRSEERMDSELIQSVHKSTFVGKSSQVSNPGLKVSENRVGKPSGNPPVKNVQNKPIDDMVTPMKANVHLSADLRKNSQSVLNAPVPSPASFATVPAAPSTSSAGYNNLFAEGTADDDEINWDDDDDIEGFLKDNSEEALSTFPSSSSNEASASAASSNRIAGEAVNTPGNNGLEENDLDQSSASSDDGFSGSLAFKSTFDSRNSIGNLAFDSSSVPALVPPSVSSTNSNPPLAPSSTSAVNPALVSSSSASLPSSTSATSSKISAPEPAPVYKSSSLNALSAFQMKFDALLDSDDDD